MTAKVLPVLGASLLSMCLVANSFAEEARFDGHELNTKLRLVHFDRDYENDAKDREQTALALEINYTTPQFGDIVGIGVSGYWVEDLDYSGLKAEDILTLDDGELDGFALIGQSYLYFTPGEKFSAKLGRMKHKSMFLSSSGSRAVPNTFQGLNADFKAMKGLSLYGAVYDKWSRRARDDFEEFATDQSAEGAIDYVGLFGAKYKWDAFTVEGEYLVSDDYLSKFGVRGSYSRKLEASNLKLSGGIFTSADDGSLFVCRSESGDLDDEDSGCTPGVDPVDNDGLGGYVQADWKKGNLTLTGALTYIDEIWIEDNFTGDHGTNPFPTRSRVGPDLTNTGETVYMAKAAYNWKDHVPGLTTHLAAAFGRDAENSFDSSLGNADEDWWEIYVRYKVPFVKGLQFTGVYHDYSSDETGTVDGVKEDETDIRLYLDYVYTFK